MKPRWLWRAKVGTVPGYVLAIKRHPRATDIPAIDETIEFRVAYAKQPPRQGYIVGDSRPWERGIVRAHIEGGYPTALLIERD